MFMRYAGLFAMLLFAAQVADADRVIASGGRLVLSPSNKPFVVWGLNYGNHGRLIEDFWTDQWGTIETDFRNMKLMGANVVRVHLQFSKFMDASDRADPKSVALLQKLVKLAESTGLYLDLTGLACYRPSEVPAWYDALSESDRWAAQANFWKAAARVGAGSDAIYCYDLMNEPIVPGERREPGKWYSGKPFGGFDYVQFITLDPAKRPREQIAEQWIATLNRAIKEVDRSHLVTVGLLPWVEKWGFLSGFVPQTVAPEMDLVSVHIYPETNKVADAIAGLKRFAVGKPVVIEETFPLSCPTSDLRKFIQESKPIVAGWVEHYDGQTIEELESLKQNKTITVSQAIWLDALKLFKEQALNAGP
jgi:hypothetical protein